MSALGELLMLAPHDPVAFAAASDFALERGWRLEVITDEEAEHDRVRSATGPVEMVLDEKGRPVRRGGLRAERWRVDRLEAWLWTWRGHTGATGATYADQVETRGYLQLEAAW